MSSALPIQAVTSKPEGGFSLEEGPECLAKHAFGFENRFA
jgi:hypothetical protein